jgi:hypothetical protein
LYSIGSSSVDIFDSRGLKLFNIQNNVVVFHEPVGHAIRIIQYLLFRVSLTIFTFTSISHKASTLVKESSCFNILITTFSQYFVGRVENLTSIFICSFS